MADVRYGRDLPIEGQTALLCIGLSGGVKLHASFQPVIALIHCAGRLIQASLFSVGVVLAQQDDQMSGVGLAAIVRDAFHPVWEVDAAVRKGIGSRIGGYRPTDARLRLDHDHPLNELTACRMAKHVILRH